MPENELKEGASYVEVNPIEIENKSSIHSNNNYRFEVNYPEMVSNEKHEILFYAVSIFQPEVNKPIIYDAIEVVDISILGTSKLTDDCKTKPIKKGQRNTKEIKIEYNSLKDPAELFINGIQYKPKADLDYNSSTYTTEKQIQSIYSPIKIFTVGENTHYVDREVQPKKLRTLIGCVVHKCKEEVNWDDFFNSGKFKEFVNRSSGVVVSKSDIDNLNNLTIYNYKK